MKALKIVFALLFINFSVKSQVNIDSLKSTLKVAPIDSTNLKKLIKDSHDLDLNEMEAKKIMNDWVIGEAKKQAFKQIEASAYYSLGMDFILTSDFINAAKYFTTALDIAEKNNLYLIQAQAYNGLGKIYSTNKQFDKAIECRKKTIEIGEKYNLKKPVAVAKYNLAGAYLSLGYNNPDTVKLALGLQLNALKILKDLKDTATIINFSNGISQAYTDAKQYDAALAILDEASEMVKVSGKEQDFVTLYIRYGVVYQTQKKYNEALKYYLKGLQLSLKYKLPQWTYNYYSTIAETYEGLGDYKKANEYNKLYSELHESIINKENFAAAADIQNKYEREKKEKEIIKLEATNVEKSNLNKILIGSTLALLALGFLGYRNFRNRQKLQQSKIIELEKDKQLQSVDAMLKGQEDERNRIAKDLHDGLGGMLSGVKMSFTNMKDNLIMSSENVGVFEQSISQLDVTIAELRKIAHNLMPEALVKFGLNDAIKDFCTSIQSGTHINIIYENLGEVRKLDNTANTYIYRIIQELINNAVKHGNPKQILVQMTTTLNKILITVEDDGKGIDTTKQAISKGIGITNIEHRVNYFKGKVVFENIAPQGTAVNIELNV
jgi:two-component system, NarL family, sensor kinase